MKSVVGVMIIDRLQVYEKGAGPPSREAQRSGMKGQTLTEIGSSGPLGAGFGCRTLKAH